MVGIASGFAGLRDPVPMSRAMHESGRSPASPLVGGCAAIMAGFLFATWGYIHRDNAPWYFDATAQALNFVVPALFCLALAVLYALYRSRVGRVGDLGFVLSLAGSAMGVAYALPWSAFGARDDLLASLVWLDTPLMWWLHVVLVGLPLIGISTIRAGIRRGPGAILLAMGACGWAYYATDSGAFLELRTAHVAFGALFSLCWIALGTRTLGSGPSVGRTST